MDRSVTLIQPFTLARAFRWVQSWSGARSCHWVQSRLWARSVLLIRPVKVTRSLRLVQSWLGARSLDLVLAHNWTRSPHCISVKPQGSRFVLDSAPASGSLRSSGSITWDDSLVSPASVVPQGSHKGFASVHITGSLSAVVSVHR
jgi:hypothetical protein